jgi:hypothetical protein
VKLDAVSTGVAITGITASGPPYGVSSDSNGAVWYTTANGGPNPNKIFRYYSGAFTQYNVPTANSEPYAITEGPPGTGMWFTEYIGNKIGNVSTSGSVIDYSIPTASSEPDAIVSACGNLWFAESNKNKIGRITPSGTITEYTIPTTNAQPHRMTVDNNGNVWFTELNGNKIAMIATTTAASTPPDGALYVLDRAPVGGVNGLILSYAAGAYHSPATSTITSLPGAGWDTIGQMTFDAAGDLWIGYQSDSGSSTYFGITEYAPGASGSATPIRAITPSNAVQPGAFWGIAVDSDGNSYVSDGPAGAVYVYAASANGSSAPIRALSGPATQLADAGKLGFDANGNLWVLAAAGILEFPPGANGNVAPTKMLSTPASVQSCLGYYIEPLSFAFDSAGNLLVKFNTSSTPTLPDLLSYAPGSASGACPSQKANLTFPSGGGGTGPATYAISIDDAGYIYTTPNVNGLAFIYSESAAFGAYPTSYAPIYATISDPNIYGPPIAIATWTNTGWLSGNARHRAEKRHRRF